MRVERSAKRNANLAWVRHFDSRIARQILTEPNETTLLYDVKFRMLNTRKPLFPSILVFVLVEPIGIEPMTLCLQSRCSPS